MLYLYLARAADSHTAVSLSLPGLLDWIQPRFLCRLP
jgi:hypothetical protein